MLTLRQPLGKPSRLLLRRNVRISPTRRSLTGALKTAVKRLWRRVQRASRAQFWFSPERGREHAPSRRRPEETGVMPLSTRRTRKFLPKFKCEARLVRLTANTSNKLAQKDGQAARSSSRRRVDRGVNSANAAMRKRRAAQPKTMRRRGGAWRRIRTTDTRIFNPLLYQLSYPGPDASSSPQQGSRRGSGVYRRAGSGCPEAFNPPMRLRLPLGLHRERGSHRIPKTSAADPHPRNASNRRAGIPAQRAVCDRWGRSP